MIPLQLSLSSPSAAQFFSDMSDIEKGNSTHVASNGGRAAARVTIASPAPLGLFSFASTTFILSLVNCSTRGVDTPNAVVGMALFCGGLAQLLAGMWEFPKGNTFGATAFSSYGAFWLSYACILIPGTGILDAYTGDTADQLNNALGFYLITWFMVTFFFFIASIRKSIGFIALFGLLSLTFILLAAGKFLPTHTSLTTAGGGVGIATAFVAYYIGLSDLLANERAAIAAIPVGAFKHD